MSRYRDYDDGSICSVTDEVPRKRRRTDSDSSSKETKKAEPQVEPSPSTSADSAGDSKPPPGDESDTSNDPPRTGSAAQELREKQDIQQEDCDDKKEETKQPKKSGDDENASPLATQSSPSKTAQRSGANSEGSDEPSSAGKLGQTICPRMPVREKPSFMDFVAKNIEYIFSMIKK